MTYKAIGGAEKFFKALATALLMPVAVFVGVSTGAIIAVLVGVLIYAALILGAVRWLGRRALGFLKSFGKAERADKVSEGLSKNERPKPPTAAVGLPGDVAREQEVFDGRAAARGRWLQ
jgi:hypothetical protein